ncbi:MAG: hypothetical protein KIT09_22115 [Bryobacteraceae bacterium]|nr:hypothetical protein [Bryobacteraceae bacterium]
MARTSSLINGDAGLLLAALEGLELQKQRIEEQIAEVKSRLGRAAGPARQTSRRVLSVAARKRIAAAQKKRWAEFRKKANAAHA